MKIGKILNIAYKNGGYIRMIDGRKKGAIRYSRACGTFAEADYKTGSFIYNENQKHKPVYINNIMLQSKEWEYIPMPCNCSCCDIYKKELVEKYNNR
ncbi:MAG: hypothetical protein ACLS20_06530 [Faecalimonas umbilicata]|uniref:hypothetical protein n=1 Tax=Faecalimonas umbilicata TaxID=1912855 RepID=UPI00399561D2